MRLSTQEYIRVKEKFIKENRITEARYIELLKGDFNDCASKITTQAVIKQLHSAGNKGKSTIQIAPPDSLNDWEYLWYYKRNLHVVLPRIEQCTVPADGVDCLPIENIDTDMEIDTMLDNLEVYIRVSKRQVPIVFKSTACDCTIHVISEKYRYTFHVGMDRHVKKVFMNVTDGCKDCKTCTFVQDRYGTNYALRPRFRRECVHDYMIGNPIGILQIVADVARIYGDRQKISRKRKSDSDTKMLRSIMVAKEEDYDTDKERVMSMYEYTKEYCESIRKEWQGGHHASPVSHPRSGYYRKAKHGTHILKDGEFVEVTRGMGNFIHVKPTIVNAHKNSVLAEMI